MRVIKLIHPNTGRQMSVKYEDNYAATMNKPYGVRTGPVGFSADVKSWAVKRGFVLAGKRQK